VKNLLVNSGLCCIESVIYLFGEQRNWTRAPAVRSHARTCISLNVRVIPQPEDRLPAASRRQKVVSFRTSYQLVQPYATLRWCTFCEAWYSPTRRRACGPKLAPTESRRVCAVWWLWGFRLLP
jgi:hypothetical protein